MSSDSNSDLESLEPPDDWDTSTDAYDNLTSSDQLIFRLKKAISRQTMKTVALMRLNDGLEESLTQACLRRAYIVNRSATISVLPHDVLSLIFQSLHHDILNEDNWWRYDEDPTARPRPEVVVSHVCKFWRDVSMSTPSLWATIDIYSPYRDLGALEPSRITEYLARSRNHLLDLELELFGSPTRQAAALNSILPHVDRWGTLYVTFGEVSAIDTLARLLGPLEPPRLSSVKFFPQLDGSDMEEGPFEYLPSPQVFTKGAPNLSVVRLFSYAMMGLQPPLSNVTSLILCTLPEVRDHPDIEVGWHMVKPVLSSPNLENLALSGYFFEPPHNAQPAQLSMPKLIHVHFGTLRGADVFWLLWNMDAPRLESLSFRHVLFADDEDNPANNGEEELPGINTLSTVRTLVFHQCKSGPNLIPYISQLCPSTTILSIVSSWDGKATFKDFIDPEREPIPWPKLDTIAVIYKAPGHTHSDSMKELLIWLLNRSRRDLGVKVLRTDAPTRKNSDEDGVGGEVMEQLGEMVKKIEYFSWYHGKDVLWPPYDGGLVEVDGKTYVYV